MSTGNVVRRLCTQCGMHEIMQCVRSGIPISSTQFSPLFIFQRGGACSKQAPPYFFSATSVVSPAALSDASVSSLAALSASPLPFACRFPAARLSFVFRSLTVRLAAYPSFHPLLTALPAAPSASPLPFTRCSSAAALLFCLPHPAASSVAVLILLSVQKTYFRSVILPDGNLQILLPESRQKMPQRAKNICALRHRHLTDKKPRKNCGVFNYCAL